jgi:hypothetical protein
MVRTRPIVREELQRIHRAGCTGHPSTDPDRSGADIGRIENGKVLQSVRPVIHIGRVVGSDPPGKEVNPKTIVGIDEVTEERISRPCGIDDAATLVVGDDVSFVGIGPADAVA